jgi:hypothetical protein
MNKAEFQDLIHRYKRSTRAEAESILLLEKQYPYSQLLHSLAARLSQDHSLENQQFELQLAAVYAADRHVLKEVMAGKLVAVANVHETIDAVDYAEVVMQDLKKLHKLKQKFEMSFVDFKNREAKTAKAQAKSAKPATPPKKELGKKSVSKQKEKPKTIAKAPVRKTNAKRIDKKTVKATKKASKYKRNQRADSGDRFISELEQKRRLKPVGSKQQQQIKLIDQFIKAQPSISSLRERTNSAPSGDLAAFKTGEFGEQIISETLVTILRAQGKKDKAIEVLKKLIWKFPQKKAYFAAQIEELKK